MEGVGNSKIKSWHWTDYPTASRLAQSQADRWPYMVLTNNIPFTVFDIDFKLRRQCESEQDYGSRLQRAERALNRLRGFFLQRYESRSKSGLGFHIIVIGKVEGKGEECTIEQFADGHLGSAGRWQ